MSTTCVSAGLNQSNSTNNNSTSNNEDADTSCNSNENSTNGHSCSGILGGNIYPGGIQDGTINDCNQQSTTHATTTRDEIKRTITEKKSTPTNISIRPFIPSDFTILVQIDQAMTVELMGTEQERYIYGKEGGDGDYGSQYKRLFEKHCYSEKWLRSITEPRRIKYLQWRTFSAVVSSNVPNGMFSDETSTSEVKDEEVVKNDVKALNQHAEESNQNVAGMLIMHERNETRRVKSKRKRLNSIELFFIYVRPTHRQRGIARMLIQHMVSKVIPMEFKLATEVRLHVLKENAVALSFYEKLGFETSCLKKDYPCKGNYSYRMILAL